MRITVARSGGYAGIVEEPTTIDTEDLDAATAERLEDIVNEIGFFTLPAQTGGGGADMFTYEISVSDDTGRTHVVSFVDDGSQETAPLRRLVEAVTAAV